MIETVETTLTLEQAYRYCREITLNHYENFPVASVLLKKNVRQHVYPIYAFARHADDLADEAADKSALLEWRRLLHQSSHEKISHPVFLALSDTIRKFSLPISLFDDLISAFLQDLEKSRYETMAEVLAYCRKSANPVGRIILLLHDYRNEQLFQYSDFICTALQLTNFWQDVSIDLQKDRIYIPQDIFQKYGINEYVLFKKPYDNKIIGVLKSLIQVTRELFVQGIPLLNHLKGRLKWELMLTVQGGLAVLQKIQEIDYNLLETRPLLTKRDWLKIAAKSFIRRTVTL
jgi:squalene synthase HpnC